MAQQLKKPFIDVTNKASGVQIVRASSEDENQLKHLHKKVRVLTDAPYYYDYAMATSRSGYYDEFWAEVFDDPMRTVMKAIKGDKIIGFVTVGPSEESENYQGLHDLCPSMGELHQIYLDPDFHGMSVGAMLYKAGAVTLSESGYSSMAINVIDKNKVAQNFYRDMGAIYHSTVREDIQRSGETYIVFCELYADNNIKRFLDIKPSAQDIQIR